MNINALRDAIAAVEIPFKTTPEQVKRLPSIATEMVNGGAEPGLVDIASDLASIDQGVYDLMVLWVETEDERDEIINDIEDSIDDYLWSIE